MRRSPNAPRAAALATALAVMLAVMLVAMAPRAAGAQAILILLFGDKIANERLQGGIKGDAVWSTLAGTPDADRRRSYDLGGFIEFKVSARFSLQPEFTFKAPAGATGLPFVPTGHADVDSAFATAQQVSVTRTLGYVTLPILAKYTIGRVGLSAGPQLGYVVKAKDRYVGTVARDDDLTYDASLWSRVNRWDAGVNLLVEYALSAKRGMHGLRARASWYRAFGDALSDVAGRNDTLAFGLGLPIGGPP